LSAPELVILDPPSEVNVNLPNQDVAFAATILGAPVVDLHARPWPARRALDLRAGRVALSRRSFTLSAAARLEQQLRRRRPELEVLDLQGPVDVQCCYPFVRELGPLEVKLPFGDRLPFPDYRLFDSFGLLSGCWRSGLWAYAILTSLGCPYGCRFCAARRRKWRPRSAEHAAAELARARRDLGIVSFEVIDDAFNVRRQRVLEFCRRVEPLNLRWACTNGLRADRFDEELARAMAQSGCVHVGFGVESVDDEVLALNLKGVTFQQIQQAVAAAGRHIPRVSGFFIVGLPGSSAASDRASIAWARQAGVDAVFSLYLPDSADPAGAADHVFYGSAAEARGQSYDPQQQKQVYREAKRLKRGRYRSMLVGERVLLRTAGALLASDWAGRVNLALMAGKKLPGMVLRGEIQ
jgi:hypothetical protein